MVVITFADAETQQKAAGFLLGRFSGHILKTGEHIVPRIRPRCTRGEGIRLYRSRKGLV